MTFAEQTVAELARTLPGATRVFHAHGIDYCCGGQATLTRAAAEAGIPLAMLAAELAALDPGPAAPPTPTDELIEHILTRFHETHRRELPELIRLAARVEGKHAAHPDVPRGLEAALAEAAAALDEHMCKEEQILFPMMRAGGHPMIAMPIERMRAEHEEHGLRLERLEQLTHRTTLPADACPTWAALYAGVRKLIDDVHEHVHLENNVLFVRFGA